MQQSKQDAGKHKAPGDAQPGAKSSLKYPPEEHLLSDSRRDSNECHVRPRASPQKWDELVLAERLDLLQGANRPADHRQEQKHQRQRRQNSPENSREAPRKLLKRIVTQPPAEDQ